MITYLSTLQFIFEYEYNFDKIKVSYSKIRHFMNSNRNLRLLIMYFATVEDIIAKTFIIKLNCTTNLQLKKLLLLN